MHLNPPRFALYWYSTGEIRKNIVSLEGATTLKWVESVVQWMRINHFRCKTIYKADKAFICIFH